MRRVECRSCGVTVEMVPWASGKTQSTHAFIWFISSWARVLSWTECARRFHSSWDIVFGCVEHAVRWGLEHRDLGGIRALGVDELAWKKGQKYLTLVYQIDRRRRRLLHVAKERTMKSFNSFFDMLGERRSKAIVFIASDMWKAFRTVIRKRCPTAIHVLDRFHVATHCSGSGSERRFVSHSRGGLTPFASTRCGGVIGVDRAPRGLRALSPR
ncbi:MAG: hypothetical protein EXR72_24400 [Myxococcales bacterium]|nr:hypothetical protein [Myxococcales bacterium]